MVAKLLVERIELLARGGTQDAGDAEIPPLAAWPHRDRGRVEIRRMPANDVGNRLREARLLAAHHLDGKVARERERRAVGEHAASGRDRFAPTRAHDLVLEILIEAV